MRIRNMTDNNVIKLPRRRRRKGNDHELLTYVVYNKIGDVIFASAERALAESVSQDVDGSYIEEECDGVGHRILKRWAADDYYG